MVSGKKVLAFALAATMVAGGAVSASAASSPVPARYTTDKNSKDHVKNTVTAKVDNKTNTATATKAEAKGKSKVSKRVLISIARNAKGKKVAITKVNANLFNSKKGKKITYANFKPYNGARMTIKAKAFNKSKVKDVKFTLGKKGKITVSKNAFKGTAAKKVTITIKAKKASQLTFKKGAFKGLSKKSVIKVKKTMSKKQFKKLSKKAKKAGFKGKIKRA